MTSLSFLLMERTWTHKKERKENNRKCCGKFLQRVKFQTFLLALWVCLVRSTHACKVPTTFCDRTRYLPRVQLARPLNSIFTMVYVVCIIVGWSKIDPTLDWSPRAVIIYFKQYNCYGTILNTQCSNLNRYPSSLLLLPWVPMLTQWVQWCILNRCWVV